MQRHNQPIVLHEKPGITKTNQVRPQDQRPTRLMLHPTLLDLAGLDDVINLQNHLAHLHKSDQVYTSCKSERLHFLSYFGMHDCSKPVHLFEGNS
eukprot:scaffold243550_cov13-Tisochrysis_lutea.AAC.1